MFLPPIPWTKWVQAPAKCSHSTLSFRIILLITLSCHCWLVLPANSLMEGLQLVIHHCNRHSYIVGTQQTFVEWIHKWNYFVASLVHKACISHILPDWPTFFCSSCGHSLSKHWAFVFWNINRKIFCNNAVLPCKTEFDIFNSNHCSEMRIYRPGMQNWISPSSQRIISLWTY